MRRLLYSNTKGVRKAGEKVKVMISTLKEQASETEDPDLQVRLLTPTIFKVKPMYSKKVLNDP